MTIYKENGQMPYTKTTTCAEHGMFGDIHGSGAALHGRFAELVGGGTGVDNLMPLDILETVHVGQ
ncbi:MAG: hypothetical protein EF813_01895 [Methanosarcinales archaeon]|nr:MAG: hypothetical protein EF813_01895 [Methanosarcinales archaeon]